MRTLLLAASLALGLAAPAAAQNCAVMKGVLQGGGTDYTTLGAAVAAIPASLTGDYCINILDGNTYNEQVEVRNVVTNDFRIYIGTDASGARPVIAPPAGSTAAFLVANASVSIAGMDIVAAQSVPYGILFSSAYAEVFDVSVSTSGSSGIYEAGARVSSYSFVDALRIHVPNAHGLWLDGSVESLVTFSTAVVEAADKQALLVQGGSFNLFSELYVESAEGDGLVIEAGSTDNYVELSTMVVKGNADAALQMTDTGGNIVTQSWMRSDAGYGAALFSGSDGNLIDFSTIVAAGSFRGLHIEAADDNIVDDCYVQHLNNYAAYVLSGSKLNTISDSHLYSNANGGNALRVAGSSTNTVTRCRIENPSGEGAAFLFGSDYNTVDASTIVSNTTNWAALRIAGSTTNVVTGSYVQNLSTTALILESGADRNSISRSTFVTNSAAPAARLHYADDNDFDLVWFRNPGTGYGLMIYDGSSFNTVDRSKMEGGLRLDGGNSDNVVTRSTMTSSLAGVYALFMQAGSSNSVTHSMISNPNETAAYLWRFTSTSTISMSTITGGGASDPALLIEDASTNTVSGSYIENPAGVGVRFTGGAVSNLISQSTVTNNASVTNPAVYFVNGAASNTVTGSYLFNQSGYAVVFASSYSLVSQSTVATAGASFPAVFANTFAVYNTLTGSRVSSPLGNAVALNGALTTVSLSTLTSSAAGFAALHLASASSNTVTDCYIQGNSTAAMAVQGGSSYNSISKTTMTSLGGAGVPALYLVSAGSNTFSQSVIHSAGGRGVVLQGASDNNVITLSSVSSAGAGQAAMLLVGSRLNSVADSYVTSALGPGLYLDAGSNSNAVLRSTVASDASSFASLFLVNATSNTVTASRVVNGSGIGALLQQASSTTLRDSSVRGSTAVVVSGSSFTLVAGASLTVNGVNGVALQMNGGSAHLNLATTTLVGGSSGMGLYLEAINNGILNVGSVTVTGAAQGLRLQPQGPGFILAIDSVTFRNLASGATAIHFAQGQYVSTITLANFEDSSVAVNVHASQLNVVNSTITMRSPRGSRLGPTYENDTLDIVDWPGYEVFPGCALTYNVGFDQPYATIQAAVDALPTTLSGHTCVVIRDAATYTEQVTVANFTNNGSSLTIRHHTGLAGGRATVRAPGGGEAAFRILNASVNVVGLDVLVDVSIPYGILASSGWVTISSVAVTTGPVFGVTTAGISLSSWSTVSYASVSVGGAPALRLEASAQRSTVLYSTFTSASNIGAVYSAGGSTNTFDNVRAHAVGGTGLLLALGSHYNTVTRSSITSVGPSYEGAFIAGSSSNTFANSYFGSLSGAGLRIDGNCNTVSGSTINGGGTGGLYIQNASSNTIVDSRIFNPVQYGAVIDAGGHRTIIARSTITSDSSGLFGLYLNGASSVTIDASYVGAPAGGGIRLRAGASNALIMRSTAAAGPATALLVEGSSDATVTDSFFTATSSDAAQLFPDAVRNTLSNSTFSVAAMTLHALHLQGASSNTLRAVYASGGGGFGLTLDAGAHDNAVSGSTLTTTGNGFALYMSAVGSNTVTGSRIFNFSGTAARVDSAAGAELSVSTVAGGGPGFAAMFVSNSSSLTFTRLNMPGCSDTCLFLNAVGYSDISASSFTGTGGINRALTVSDSSWNVITESYFGSFTGNTVRFDTGSEYNTVSQSTIAGNSAANPALHVSGSPSNTFSGVRVENMAGQAALFSGSDYNRVVGSTAASRDDEGLRIESSSAVWVVGSYVQGATATHVSNSYGAFLHSSVFAGVTGALGPGCAVRLQGAGQPTVSSNTLISHNDGACVDVNNYGLVLVASNVVTARGAGVRVNSQAPQTPQVWVSSNSIRPVPGFMTVRGLHFDGLTSGATVENNSVYFRSGGGVAGTTAYGLSAQSSSGLAIRRNRFNMPNVLTLGSLSMIDLSNVNGSFQNNDVHAVVLTTLDSTYLLSVNGGSVDSRENIFSSSFTVPGTSSFTVHSVGGGLVQSNYNVYHSSNGLLSFHWNGVGVAGLPAWISQSFRDQASTVGHPYWAGTANFAEDFHPKSTAGRYDPAAAGFVLDVVDSASIDAGNPATYYGGEPAPNGFHANAGSTGGTSEASKAPTGACAVVRKVCKTGGCPYASIQSAVDSIPNPLVGHSCVSIRDASTYNESVTIASFTLAGSSITIAVDQSATTGTPVIMTSVMGHAILDIRVASVTVSGPLELRTMAAMSRDYGVYVASPSVRLSSVSVFEGAGQINIAGVRLSTESTLSYSTVTVTNSVARAFWSTAPYVTVSYSSFSWTGGAGGGIPIFEMRGAFNALNDVRVHSNGTRDAALLEEVSDLTVTRATFTAGGGYAVLIGTAADVTLAGTVMTSLGRALIIDSTSDGVTIDRSSITASPGATIAGASVAGSSHVLTNVGLFNNGTGPGLELQGWYHRLSTFTAHASDYALRLLHSTGTVVEGARLQGLGGGAMQVLGGERNLITDSSMTALGAGSPSALRIQSSSSNYVARVSLQNAGNTGYGLYLDGSSSNTVSVATITTSGGIAGLYFGNGASSNTLSDLRVTNYGGHGVFFDAFANLNVVDRATVTAMGFSSYGVGFNNASSNTLTGLVVVSTDNAAMYFSMTSNWNSVARASVTAPGSGDIALYLANGSSNTVADSYLAAPSGWAALLSPGSRNNVIERSTMSSGSGSQAALEISQTDDNVVRRSVIVSTGGYRAALLSAGPLRNLIEDTEIRLTGGGSGFALDMVSGSSNVVQRAVIASSLNGANLDGSSARILQSTVSASGRGVVVAGPAARLEDSYVSGSTAVYVFNPSTPTLRGNRLVGTAFGGHAVYVASGGGGLDFSSNTVTGPASGVGVQLAANMGGDITLSSNTFLPGAMAQFVTNDLYAGSQLRITSNTFVPTIQTSTNSYGIVLAGLSRGATIQHNSIVYRSPGAMTGFVSYGLYSVVSSGLRVDHNRYSQPGMVTAGGAAAFYFSQSAVDFRYNDVFSSGTANTAPYQLQIVNALSVSVRNSIFVNAMTAFSGQAVTLFMDAASQPSFASDYNDFHMITGNARVGRWTGVNQLTLGDWQSASGKDANSLSADPLWFSTATEDFHVRSPGGRWDPLTQAFVTTDAAGSPTIDKADPSDAPGPEPFPGASRANMGSYGQTAEASKAAPPAGCSAEYTVAPGFYPDIQTAITAVGTTLTNNPCVVIRQASISEGNVNVPVLTTNDNRLTIMGEPGIAVTMDSGGFADGFIVAGASVTIRDLVLSPSLNAVRAVRATGSDLRLSSVTVDGGSTVMGTAVSVTTNAVVEYSVIEAAGVALQLSGSGATVLYSTAATSAASSAALRLDGTLNAALTGVYAGASGSTAAVLAGGARNTSISASSFTSVSGWAFHVLGATRAVVTGSWLQAPVGPALRFDGGSYDNVVAGSTITTSGPGMPAVAFVGGSSNTVTECYLQTAGPSLATLGAGTRLNTLSSMTLVGSIGAPLIDAVGSSSNTFASLYLKNLSGPALSLTASGSAGSAYNTVDLSTIVTVGAATHALDIQDSSGTRVTRSYLQGSNNAVRVLNNSNHTLIELSTMSAQNDAALNVQFSTGTTVRRSMVLNSAGNRALYALATHLTSVESSTVALTAVIGAPAMEFSGGSELAVLGSYAQGGRGIAFSGVTNPSVLYSSVVALAVDEVGVWLTGGLSGTLRVSSSVIQGGGMGPQSAGLRVDAAGTGQISVTTNTFLPGSRFNVFIATQNAGARVHVAGNQVFPTLTVSTEAYGIMLHGVKTGATVQNNTVLYRTAGATVDAAIAIYSYSSDGVLIERNRVNQPGVVTSGGFIGIGINDTPRSLVRFNDVYGAGNLGFGSAFAALNSTGIVLTNNALSTWFTGASTRTIDLDAASAGGLRLGYNLYHSSAGPVTAYVGSTEYPFPFTFPLITDPDPVQRVPHWFSVVPGSEDFHPRSQAGRWDPSVAGFVNDAWTSAGIDHADENEPVGTEQTPNGSRANIGSYGGTAEASRSPSAPGAPAVAAADAASIQVSFTDSGSPQGHIVGASTAPLFTGVTLSSQGAAGAIPLRVSGLLPNVTYYMIAGAIWGDAFIFSGMVSTPTHAQMPAPAATPFPEVNVTSASASWGTQSNPLSVTTYTVSFSTTVSFPNSLPGTVVVSSVPSVSEATVTATGLVPNTTYFVFLGARNHAGVMSSFLQYTTATLAAAPSGLAAGSPTDTTAPLSWSANGNPLVITTYTVLVSTASDFTGGADFLVSSAPALGAGMTPGGLTPASTYYFRLRALNHAGSASDYADVGPVVTLPLSINPPTPGVFTAGSSVTLSANWSLSTGATGYTLVASTMSVSPPVDIADSSSTVGQGSTQAVVDGLTPNTTYFLFVRAHGNNGNSPYAAFTATATQPSQPLSAPSTFTDVNESSFTVSWLANGNPLAMTTYTIVASTAADFNAGASSVTLSTVPAWGPSATLTLLSPYTLYYVGVRALGQGTGITTMTVLGSTQTLPVSLGLPGPLATGVSASSASASWSLVAGATGYSLVASLNSINPPVSAVWVSSIAGGSSANGAVFGLSPLTTYYLFVRADGPGNSGAYDVYPATATDPLPPLTASPPFTAVNTGSLVAQWEAGANPVGVASYTVTLSTYGVFPNAAGSNQVQTVVPAGATGGATFGGLNINATYHVYVEALSHAGARFGLFAGSTSTLADPPGAGSILKNGVSSVTVQWGLGGNPAITSYTVVASTASDFNAFASSVVFTTASVTGVATVPGLSFGTTWHFQVQAVNHSGIRTTFSNLGSTYTYLSNIIPLIVDNQSGDDAWRRTNAALYDVDFADGSGLGLDKVQVSVSTNPGGAADLVAYVDTVIGLGGAPGYSADFGLPAAAFNAIPEGSTAYVSVRIFNLVPATNTLVDVFYVRKDTTAPVIGNFEVGGDTVVQTAAGRLYDVRALDAASGLDVFQYSVSATPATPDESVLPWTDIAALSGATDYTTPWPVAFAALRDGTTNYVSVRAVDVAGATTTVVDAFRVFKDTTGPAVSISTPNAGTGFVSNASSAGGSVTGPFGVSGASVAVQQVAGGLYWNGASFISATPVWIAATGGSSWTVTSLGVTFSEGVQYRLIARGSTPYGQFSTVFATATFTIDSTAPSVAVTSPTALATVASIPQLSGTAADAVAGVSSIEVRLLRLSDGQWWNWFTEAFGATPVSSVTAGGTAWSVTPSALLQASLRSGSSYYVAVRANDDASPPNSGDFFVSGSTFTFDDPTPPAAVTDLAAVNGTLPGDVRLTWTAPGAHGSDGITQVGQYAVFASTDMLAVPSTAAAMVIIPTGTVIPGQFQGYIGGNGTLTPGNTYFLWVALSNADGNWGAFSNQASTTATPAPSNTILGHVVDASTNGITAVRIDAYNDSGTLVATAFTVADGSGTYSVTGLSAGNYKVEASWTANGITSSVWIDGIPMGSVNIDFVLNINYALATLTGTLGALSSQGQAGLGVAGSGYRPSAEGSHVELHQRGVEVARVSPDPTGRWSIGHLLPGSYRVRAYTGLGYTDFQDVDLAEGEIRTIGFVFNPLPDATVFAFPNPARHSTTIRFETALQPLEAQISIFDLKGALVREVPGSQITATATPGLYHYVWDLTNAQGRGVASGVYLFMVKVKGGSENQLVKVIKKLAVVR